MARVSAQGIDEKTVSDFKEVVRLKYDKLHTVYGLEIEKALKMYLAATGHDKYQNDPDVVSLLGLFGDKTDHTHTHNDSSKDEINHRSKSLERKTQNRITKHKHRISRERERKGGPMDMFASLFKEEYKGFKQVSWNEIAGLAGSGQGVADKRSIKNRINFLVANGYIESYAPNVYNVKL